MMESIGAAALVPLALCGAMHLISMALAFLGFSGSTALSRVPATSIDWLDGFDDAMPEDRLASTGRFQ